MSPLGALERLRVRLPVRLKLAIVSAGLTFFILLLFAVVVGTVAERRVSGSFDNELRATAADLQQIAQRQGGDATRALDVLRAASAGGAQIRILDRSGNVVAPEGAIPLAPPADGVQDVGAYHVATRPIFGADLPETNPFHFGSQNAVVGYLQYAKPERNLTTTIAKVRLFLAFGVLGGTALAFLAGFLVARRAMRPIAGLTHAAREVARTRDPDVAPLPKPVARDEVAELADTLEDMLRELGEARTESESALARQRAFVADASHELRTPLTSILANLELLEAELEGEQQEIAGSALRSSRRMRRLVADLLLLARADAGREAPRRPVDLSSVAREAAAETGPLGGEDRVAIDAPKAVPVEGVPDDLHRLALNLIENALIHTPQGTPVTVAVREEDGSAVLEVSDRGPGIPAGLRERVFERFSRGAGSGDVSPARSGSGLGLAIVRAVADGHGGSVDLGDAEGGGARFLVRLPVATREPDEAGPTPRQRPAAPSAGA
jgi:two-component system OmpR family sensor kinase